jgi:membrane protein DedA with SNARE-associated domain
MSRLDRPPDAYLVMPLSGWMLVQQKGLGFSGLLLAGFFGALGNLLGSLAAYGAGAWGGRPFLERFGRYLLVTRQDLERADRWFARYGELAVLVSRMLPVVRTFISFPAGVARMDLPRFCLFTFVGSFPWSLGLAWGGYLLGQNWESLRRAMRPFDLPVLLALAALVALYLWVHLRGFRRQALPSVGPSSVGDDSETSQTR